MDTGHCKRKDNDETLTFGVSVLDNVGDERIVSVGAGRSRPREGHSTAGRLLPQLGHLSRFVDGKIGYFIIPGFEGVAAVRAVLKNERQIQIVSILKEIFIIYLGAAFT